MMMSLKTMVEQNKNWIMDNNEKIQDSYFGSNSNSSSSEVESNLSSSDSEGDEGNSSSSSSSSSHEDATGALMNMSNLLQELPFKRGLSKHYNGKSQSFTSISNVGSLEDLAKPENPYNKKLKSCKSYGVFNLEGAFNLSDLQPPSRSSSFSRLIGSKKTIRGPRRNGSFLGNNNNNSRPPLVPPHTSTSFTNQTPLFA